MANIVVEIVETFQNLEFFVQQFFAYKIPKISKKLLEIFQVFT